MAGVVINPGQVTGLLDTHAISCIVDRLLDYVRSGKRNNRNICGLCLLLSRAIDDAVSNNEIPPRAIELPVLLKEVSKWTDEENVLTAIMVVMMSIKGACRNGWFREKDNEELHTLWTEIATNFCSVKDMNSGENTVKNGIKTVLSRFYPRMKMGEIFTFIEAPPGHGAFVRDFHIAKNAKSPDEEVYLFVAQTDNTETSSCLTSPQLVSFFLNGKAVNMRTGIYKDPGPQIPTDITDLVRYGTTNLLQAVGQFNGIYIIVVAFMSMITNPSCPELPVYVPPVTVASDLDNDIVEGPSTISLNCPISFKHIVTPVKGHLCNHLQCFDFENYVDINSRRPSWRCPHCSQSVCFTDIRIDQKMAKVLKEVGVTISHVKITADGSWKHVNECDDHTDEQHKPLLHQESNPSLNKGEDIMDLTKGGNDIDVHQENEEKPSLAQLQAQPNHNEQIPSHLNMNPVYTNTSPHMESGSRSNVAYSQGQTVIPGSNNMQSQTHGIWTSRNPNLQGQSQIPASSMQFQQSSMNNMSNSYGRRYMTPGRHVNWAHQGVANVSSRPAQQFGAHSSPFHQSNSHQFNSYQQQPVNHMVPNPSVVGPTIDQVSNQQVHRYVGPTNSFVCNQPVQNYVGPTNGSISNQQTHNYSNATVSQAFTTQQGSGSANDQNWRPVGRMRGSLGVRAYSDAFSQSIIYPTEPVQAAVGPPVLNTPRPFIPAHLQVSPSGK